MLQTLSPLLSARGVPAVCNRVAPSLGRRRPVQRSSVEHLPVHQLHSTSSLQSVRAAVETSDFSSASPSRDGGASASTSIPSSSVQHTPASQQSNGSSSSSTHSSSNGSSSLASSRPGPRPGPDSDLMSEINSCEVVDDVLDIASDEADGMSVRCIVAALSRLQNITRRAGTRSTQLQALTQRPAFLSLLGQLQPLVTSMNAMQLSNSLYCLAQLECRLPQPLLAEYALAAKTNASSLYPRDLSTIIHAFATLRMSPGIQVLDTLQSRCIPLLQAGKFEPQGVSMLLHSLATLHYSHPKLNAAAGDEALRLLPQFTPQGLANIAWAQARLGYHSKSLLIGATERYVKNPAAFKAQEACNLLWALSHQRHHPQAAFGAFIPALTSRASTLAPADVTTILYSLATFGTHPGRTHMGLLCKQGLALLPSLSPTELASLYWSLGMLHETRQKLFTAIGELLPATFEQGQVSDSTLRQIFQGFLSARLDEEELQASSSDAADNLESLTAGVFPAKMMESMKRAWALSVNASGGKAPSSHEEVLAILELLQVKHDTARPTKDGIGCVDVALKPNPDRFIALQILKDRDLTSEDKNAGTFPSVKFERQILERNGWEVKYLRLKDLAGLSAEKRPFFVADLLNTLGVKAVTPKPSAVPVASSPTVETESSAEDYEQEYVEEAMEEDGPMTFDKSSGRKPQKKAGRSDLDRVMAPTGRLYAPKRILRK